MQNEEAEEIIDNEEAKTTTTKKGPPARFAAKFEKREKQQKLSIDERKLQELMASKDVFLAQIQNYIGELEEEIVEVDNDKVVEGRDISVCIRARPLLQHEVEQGYFEVVHSQNPKFHFMEPSFSVKKVAQLKSEACLVD